MISIITVTFNAEKTIKSTLESILSQSAENFELIIKDANSKDKTVELINKYIPLFEKKKINIKIITKEDSGIYDGMNQAIDFIEEEWVYFLNAGDTFYNRKSLENIIRNLNNNFDIIYGAVNASLNNDYFQIRKPLELKMIRKGMIFCHQGVVIKSELMKKEKYDIRYKVCADYNFFLKMYLNKKKFKEIDVVFSNYDLNGYSNENPIMAIKETKKIINSFNSKVKLNIEIYFLILIFKETIKKIIKKICGGKFFFILRKINIKIKSKIL